MGSSPYKNSPKYLFYRPFTKRKKVVFDHLFSFSYEPQCDEPRKAPNGALNIFALRKFQALTHFGAN